MSALITSNIFDDGFFAFPHELAFFEPPCGTAKQVCKRQRQWPRMDIVEHDKEYLVTADTPGVPTARYPRRYHGDTTAIPRRTCTFTRTLHVYM